MLQNEDLPLLNYGTLCFRTFVATAPNYLLKMDFAPKLLEITKYILKPEIIEAAAQHLGYLIVNIFDKVMNSIYLIARTRHRYKCAFLNGIKNI